MAALRLKKVDFLVVSAAAFQGSPVWARRIISRLYPSIVLIDGWRVPSAARVLACSANHARAAFTTSNHACSTMMDAPYGSLPKSPLIVGSMLLRTMQTPCGLLHHASHLCIIPTLPKTPLIRTSVSRSARPLANNGKVRYSNELQ